MTTLEPLDDMGSPRQVLPPKPSNRLAPHWQEIGCWEWDSGTNGDWDGVINYLDRLKQWMQSIGHRDLDVWPDEYDLVVCVMIASFRLPPTLPLLARRPSNWGECFRLFHDSNAAFPPLSRDRHTRSWFSCAVSRICITSPLRSRRIAPPNDE